MGRLNYSAIMSLDGFTSDDHGNFDWAAPDPELHTAVNDLERGIGTYLYGRRMYETMRYWETAGAEDDQPAHVRDFAALWRAATKVVYSSTLTEASTAHTTIERAFEPAAVQRLKDAAPRDVSVGGPHLAGQALAAGLVDDLHLFVVPVIVGGGTRALPDGLRTDLELVTVDHFAGGAVRLHYRLSR